MSAPPHARVWIYTVMVLVCGLLVLYAALRFGGGAPQAPIPGLPDPGPITEWGLPLARFALDVCGIAVVGLLVTGVVVCRTAPPGAVCVRAAGRWAIGWALSAAALFLLTVSNLLGVPPAEVLSDASALAYGLEFPEGRAPLVVVAPAVAVAVGARLRLTAARGTALLVVATAGLLPMVSIGHAASADHHDIALSGIALHTVAVAVWVGGLAAILIHLRHSDLLPSALPRFSTIALAAFIAVAVSGTTNAWIRLSTPAELWTTPYGRLLLVKTVLLGVMGVFGALHRRRIVARIAELPGRRAFRALAAGEIAVMTATIALAVGLSRTPPPPTVGEHRHLLLDYDLEPFALVRLLTAIRVDPLILVVLAAATAGYLIAVRRLAFAGEQWPLRHTLAWLAGVLLMALVLITGIGGYSRAVFAVHITQLTVLGVLAPALLALGAPLTLASRVLTERSQYGQPVEAFLRSRWGRRITHPLAVTLLYALPSPLLHLTGLLELAVGNHPVHLATQALFVTTGTLLFTVVLGVDPLPRPITWAIRLRMLLVASATHLLLAAVFLTGPILAEDWFLLAAPPASPDLATSRHIAAAVTATTAVLVFGAAIIHLLTMRRAAKRRIHHARAAAGAGRT